MTDQLKRRCSVESTFGEMPIKSQSNCPTPLSSLAWPNTDLPPILEVNQLIGDVSTFSSNSAVQISKVNLKKKKKTEQC